MSLSPNEKYPGATEADPNYKDSKFKDNNPSTTNNGSPLKALDRNEQLALQEAMMNAAGFDYNGVVDTPQNSQMFNAYKAALSNGANLLSNHNFLIASPDDSQPAPSATPTSYPPGYEIFSGVFANETTGILNLTYIDGRVSFSGGDFYMSVPNTGALENITEFVASVADFDGKPRTRGVSYALVGDEYRVTVGVDALEDESANETLLGSVKFEQGSVATGHSAKSLFDIYGHPNVIGYVDPRAISATNDTLRLQGAAEMALDFGVRIEMLSKFSINGLITLDGGVDLVGRGDSTGLIVDNAGIACIQVRGDNSQIKDFSVYGEASGVIQVRGASDANVDGTKISNILFESISESEKLNQCVWLWTSTNTSVERCRYKKTGYGVIGQFGYVANDVSVHRNTFTDMINDAVEANSGGPVKSYRWSITNNRYNGNLNFPFSGNEGRFVGLASVSDSTISDNIVVNAGGDSAIHVESEGSTTVIADNIFIDCFGAQGQDGWIYLLNNTKDANITGNFFVYTDSSLGLQSAISVSSGSYIHKGSWSNNTFIDLSGTNSFNAFSAKNTAAGSKVVISGNVADGIRDFIEMVSTNGLSITSNIVSDAINGIFHNPGATGGGSSDLMINGNDIEASGFALFLSTNTNGTSPCEECHVTSNKWRGNVRLRSTVDSTFALNQISASGNLELQTNTRLTQGLNSQVGTGPI